MYAQYFLLLEYEDLLLSVFYIIKDIWGLQCCSDKTSNLKMPQRAPVFTLIQ